MGGGGYKVRGAQTHHSSRIRNCCPIVVVSISQIPVVGCTLCTKVRFFIEIKLFFIY